MSEKRRRQQTVTARLTESERQRILKAADQRGLTVSAFVRTAAVSEAHTVLRDHEEPERTPAAAVTG